MSFTQELWHNNIELYQKTLNLPFNQELAAGLYLPMLFVIM
jgi:thiaminase/transcriptional activator TenA